MIFHRHFTTAEPVYRPAFTGKQAARPNVLIVPVPIDGPPPHVYIDVHNLMNPQPITYRAFKK